ncbi:MAG: DUF1501 domain-containing protein [Akkermansiaceae bacterium]
MTSRRQFLGEASCSLVGSSTVVSTLLNLKLANQAAASSLRPGDDKKTIVSILLGGGCDTFNLLVPRDGRYNEYSNSRGGVGGGGVALAQNSLIPLNQRSGGDGQQYGLHPSCQRLAEMFNGTGPFSGKRRLAFVSNVGTLIQPTTMSQYKGGSVPLPKSLFSHIDQITQWQTSLPQGGGQLTGWAGRMADVLHSSQNTGRTAMSISLSGNNVFQIGNATSQFSITQNGALLLNGDTSGNSQSARKNRALESMVAETYRNLVQDTISSHTAESLAAQEAFDTVFKTIDDSAVANLFASNKFAQQLRVAAKTIAARTQLGLRRSSIFIERGGWDAHGELLNTQAAMLTEISEALNAYQRALEHFGVAEDVITYTASDFGRTLRSNGRGTDHAWGGNQIVMGGPIDAGKIHGSFPSLALNGDDDIGQGGRILPSTSIDEFFAEMATWFGIKAADMPAVLPNLENFVDIARDPKPVGYLTS